MHKYFYLILFSTPLALIHSCGTKLPTLTSTEIDSTGTLIDSSIQIIDDNPLRYQDWIYRDNIKTVKLHKAGLEMSEPIIALRGHDQLLLSFDDLDADAKDYLYTVIYCNADWTRSELSSYDFIDGFEDQPIQDYEYAYNTIQPYTHYRLTFPHGDFSLTKAGNYLLLVYLEDQEQPVISRRFMVIKKSVSISININRPNRLEYRNTHQEIDFKINYEGLDITNPFEEIKVVLMQNNRWDKAIFGLIPIFMRDQELIYDYNEQNVLTAGKEFRGFDFQSIRYLGQRVESINATATRTDVHLFKDAIRSYMKYIYYKDLNGKYVINVHEGNKRHIEADYAYVHFNLVSRTQFTGGKLYVIGAFCDWNLRPSNRMNFNAAIGGYEATIYLKQGFYNYEYVFVKGSNGYSENGQQTPDETLIEGNYFETENEYTILVYHHRIGLEYDELIGVKSLNTFNNIR